MMKRWLAYGCCLIFLVGCATSLTKRHFPREKIKDVVAGKTTQRDIYSGFGEPVYHGMRENQEWWMYIHTTDDNSESLSLYFDEDGVVSDFHYSPFKQSYVKKEE